MSAISADSLPQDVDDKRLERRIRERTDAVIRAARSLCASHGAVSPCPEIRFNLRGQAAGQVQWRGRGQPLLRYNLAFARRQPEEFLATVVVHEVAHLVTFACFGRTRPHGREWRSVMRFLGIARPQRCHDFPLDPQTGRRQRRWSYQCDCRVHQLSTTRHNRARSGTARYRCRSCGTALRHNTDEVLPER